MVVQWVPTKMDLTKLTYIRPTKSLTDTKMGTSFLITDLLASDDRSETQSTTSPSTVDVTTSESCSGITTSFRSPTEPFLTKNRQSTFSTPELSQVISHLSSYLTRHGCIGESNTDSLNMKELWCGLLAADAVAQARPISTPYTSTLNRLTVNVPRIPHQSTHNISNLHRSLNKVFELAYNLGDSVGQHKADRTDFDSSEIVRLLNQALLCSTGQPNDWMSSTPYSPPTNPSWSRGDEERNTNANGLDACQSSECNANSALDALIHMTSASMQRLNRKDTHPVGTATNLDVACLVRGTRASKRRKTRTTFSNSQLSELEHNFNRQKYLTPSDRDRIAKHLGLSNTQVITWFQNRRAKLKREAEELERDILAARQQEQQKVLGRSTKNLSDDWRSQPDSPFERESTRARPRERSGSVEEHLLREDWDEHTANAVANVSFDKSEKHEVIRQSVQSIERNLNRLLKVKKSASETVWSPADELEVHKS
ncbi:hypothetical protein EG68_02601 [Paragonimus skrjabini miyazakii]|uniref:Homeobox domain-containing protein n=1 Tax=Paragonimus skrjabini miyazakii TaxID=59628 RepID=A0A8S9ZBX6_9TREM|nr:hypothetical protein EG68_02601 [Paragonimus skrjabini miyazakii]